MRVKKIFLFYSVLILSLFMISIFGHADMIRVSVASDGSQSLANSISRPYVSNDGRYVAFSSSATNLVPNDNNSCDDVFVYDTVTKNIERVSVDNTGAEGNLWSKNPSISADGRYVAFNSEASNLVINDTNNAWDTFVYDRNNSTVERVSVTAGNVEGNQGTSVNATFKNIKNVNDVQLYTPAISADGRYVAFTSDATNLVTGDTNGKYDIFVKDRNTGAVERVSVDKLGNQADNGSYDASISSDGQYVVFNSSASNLVANDTNKTWDTFVYDRNTSSIERVSLASDGTQGNGPSVCVPFISQNARFVTFTSLASNLVSGDTNVNGDVFVHDRDTDTTTRVSVASNGTQANNSSYNPTISADGRYVAFASAATNLVAGTANGINNIFVYDRDTNKIWCVSLSGSGTKGNAHANIPTYSADGNYLAFRSDSSNLVSNDTNGKFDIFMSRAGERTVNLTMAVSPAAAGNTNPTGTTQVAIATPVNISATPAANYNFINWTGTGAVTITDADSADTTVSLTDDGTVTANFAHVTATLTMAVTGNGSTDPAVGEHTVNTVTAINITATADANNHFVSWTVTEDGVVANSESASTTVTLTGNTSVTANFAHDTATLTVVTTSGGTVDPAPGNHVVNTATAINITATADANNHFVSWTVTANGVMGNLKLPTTTVTITGNTTVTANFAHDTAILIMMAAPAEGGTTNPLPVWQNTVNTATAINITATPAENYHFVNWTVVGNGAVGDANSAATTVTITGNTTVTANFAHDTAILTLAVSGEGTTDPAVGEHTVDTATAINITATPAENHHFVSWTVTGDGAVGDANSATTTVTITGNTTVTANFAHDTATLTMAVSGEGTTDPAVGEHTVNTVTVINITATPAENHHFVSWTVTGDGAVGNTDSATTTVTLTGNTALTANFTGTQHS